MLGLWCLLVRRISFSFSYWLFTIRASILCYLHTYQWNGDRLEKRTKWYPLRKYKIYIKLHHQSFSPFRDRIGARWWISWQESDCFPKSLILWSVRVHIILFRVNFTSRIELTVALCLLSLWLMSQLSCYHTLSVKRWGWNDDHHIQRWLAFKSWTRTQSEYYLHYNLQFAW